MEVAPDAAMSSKQRRAYGVARRTASRVLKNRFRTLSLTREAYDKLFRNEGGLSRVRDELGLLIRFVRAWGRREYRVIPWRPLLYATAALVYFVSPMDLIPDLLPGLGFVDDVAVVTAVLRSIQRELGAFSAWEDTRATTSETISTG